MFVRQCIKTVRVESAHIEVELSAIGVADLLAIDLRGDTPGNPSITIDATLKRSGRAVRLVQDGIAQSTAGEPQEHLLKLIHRARSWWHEIVDRKLTVSTLAQENQVTSSYASRVVRLNFLAPKIVEVIVSGNQPVDLDAKKLLGLSNLPLCWEAQMKLLLGR